MVVNLVLPQPTDLGDEWGNALNAGIMGVNSDVEALKGRLITAGEGLLGGGDLTQHRSLAIDFADSGQVDGTKAVRANDSRLSDARTPLTHAHAIGDVTGLQGALDAKAAAGHGHAQGDVTGLVSALAGKAPTVHTHAEGDVTGLTSALAGKVPTSRTLTAGTGLTGGGDLAANRSLAVQKATISTASFTPDSNVTLNSCNGYLAGEVVTVHIDLTSNINFSTAWVLATIPSGYRPPRNLVFIGVNANTGALISFNVQANGNVQHYAPGVINAGNAVWLTATYVRA